MEKEYLQKKLKHTNFDGIIYYGENGNESINLIDLLKDYKQQLDLLVVVKSVKDKELLNFEGWYVTFGYKKTVAGNFIKRGIRYSESELYHKYEIEYLQ